MGTGMPDMTPWGGCPPWVADAMYSVVKTEAVVPEVEELGRRFLESFEIPEVGDALWRELRHLAGSKVSIAVFLSRWHRAVIQCVGGRWTERLRGAYYAGKCVLNVSWRQLACFFGDVLHAERLWSVEGDRLVMPWDTGESEEAVRDFACYRRTLGDVGRDMSLWWDDVPVYVPREEVLEALRCA